MSIIKNSSITTVFLRFFLRFLYRHVNIWMNTLIIGDSWGVFSPWGRIKYNAINISAMGQGNMANLKSAFSFMQCNERPIDLIVWYYTSLCRDGVNLKIESSFHDYLNAVHEELFTQVSRLRKTFPKPKWAIIGGHAPIFNKEKYNWAEFVVEDWRSELVGSPVPQNQSLGLHNVLDGLKQSYPNYVDELIRELDAEKEIIELGKKHTPDVFSDGVHPNMNKSTEMCERILDFFKQ